VKVPKCSQIYNCSKSRVKFLFRYVSWTGPSGLILLIIVFRIVDPEAFCHNDLTRKIVREVVGFTNRDLNGITILNWTWRKSVVDICSEFVWIRIWTIEEQF